MGQSESKAPPPPYEYKTDTTLDTFSIPDKIQPEFDDAIVDHNEKVFTYFALINTKAQTKATELKLKDFDEENKKEGDGFLSDTEFLFGNVAMGQTIMGGNYECMKDWNGIDLLGKKFTAMERRKLVEDLHSCGKANFSGITDSKLQQDAYAFEDYRSLCAEKETLPKFKHYYNILKNDQNVQLEDDSNGTDVKFEEKDRKQMDELAEKLNLQKTLKTAVAYGDDIVSLPPSFHILAMQLMTAHCRGHILDCLKKTYKLQSNEEVLNTASVFEYQQCLLGSQCFSKLGVWLQEKIDAEAKIKK